MKRWRLPCVFAIAGAIWLPWAFPRFHPSSRLGLRFDREGFVAQARQLSANHGADVRGWRAYVKPETKKDHQELRLQMPDDEIARAFPSAVVAVTFLPHDESAAASITLRPDGRPLDWKLPAPKTARKGDPAATADAALQELAGATAARFKPTTAGASSRDGVEFSWERVGPAPETPQIRIDTFVTSGEVTRADTNFTSPEAFQKRIDKFPVVRVSAGVAWSILLLLGFAIPILREGSANAARSMKDRSAIWLAALFTLLLLITGFIEWDNQMVESSNGSNGIGDMVGIFFSAVLLGVFVYALIAAAFLNARLHPDRLRALRLLPTAGVFSRLVGSEILGGWLSAPALVCIPLAVSALLSVSAERGYSDAIILNRFPVLDTLFNVGGQETVFTFAFLGLILPLSLRFTRLNWVRVGAIALAAVLTSVMLSAPFPRAEPASLLTAAATAGLMVWLYLQFGVLGAMAAHLASKIIISAGALLVQPVHSLQNSGAGILAAFACIGVYAFIAAWRGPEISTQLYGETGARIQPRTRREELLAEFNVARSAQQQMLPLKAPDLAGYTIAATCEPAREVGGDLYDFVRLPDGRLGIGVADVSGKGVPAALYMTLTKGLLCAASQDSSSPHTILTSVNTHLRDAARKKVFVTMAFGVLDPGAMTLEYVRAGHNPIVWRRLAARETRMLSAGGMALGLTGPVLFAKTLVSESIALEPGDALVFYSDGLTEAMNAELEQFGDDRLIAAVEHADGMSAQATMDSILIEVKSFLQGGQSQDDLTLAVLRVSD